MRFRDFVIKETAYAPGARQPRHTHDYASVTVVINGQIDETTPHGEHRGHAGSVVLKAAGTAHEDRVGGFGARTLSIQLQRGLVADRISSRGWMWFEDASVVRAAVALCSAAKRDVEDRAIDLLAAVDECRAPQRTWPRWLPAVISRLNESSDEPLRLQPLAETLGLHPVYLSRAFRQHTGMTMSDYLRRVRLTRVRQLLGMSKHSITAIASETGFTDISHLTRTFSDAFGVTPSAFRNVCRRG